MQKLSSVALFSLGLVMLGLPLNAAHKRPVDQDPTEQQGQKRPHAEKLVDKVVVPNNEDTIIEFIEKQVNNVNVNACAAGTGLTILIEAAASGYLRAVKMLVEKKNAKFDLKDVNGYNALHHAAIGGHVEVVKYLIKEVGMPVDAPTDPANPFTTALFWAASRGQLETIKILTEQCDATVDLRNNNNQHRLLPNVATKPQYFGVFEYLLSHLTPDRGTVKDCLECAATCQNEKVIEILIKKGFWNPEKVADNLFFHILHRPYTEILTADENHKTCAFLLEKKYFDPYQESQQGITPLNYAIRSGKPEAKLLMENAGVSVLAAALGDAIRHDKIDAVKMIIAKNRNVLLLDDIHNPLGIALLAGKIDVFKMMLELLTDEEIKCMHQKRLLLTTALGLAQPIEVLELMFKRGFDPNEQNHDGTLLDEVLTNIQVVGSPISVISYLDKEKHVTVSYPSKILIDTLKNLPLGMLYSLKNEGYEEILFCVKVLIAHGGMPDEDVLGIIKAKQSKCKKTATDTVKFFSTLINILNERAQQPYASTPAARLNAAISSGAFDGIRDLMQKIRSDDYQYADQRGTPKDVQEANSSNTILHALVFHGCVELLDARLPNFVLKNLNCRRADGHSPLLLAIQGYLKKEINNNQQIRCALAKKLIEDLNCSFDYHELEAAIHAKNASLVRLILAQNARRGCMNIDQSVQFPDGTTLLMRAIKTKDMAIINALCDDLQKRSNCAFIVNMHNKSHDTALSMAVDLFLADVVQRLVLLGADVHQKNTVLKGLLHRVCKRYAECAKSSDMCGEGNLESLRKIMAILVEAGAKVAADDQFVIAKNLPHHMCAKPLPSMTESPQQENKLIITKVKAPKKRKLAATEAAHVMAKIGRIGPDQCASSAVLERMISGNASEQSLAAPAALPATSTAKKPCACSTAVVFERFNRDIIRGLDTLLSQRKDTQSHLHNVNLDIMGRLANYMTNRAVVGPDTARSIKLDITSLPFGILLKREFFDAIIEKVIHIDELKVENFCERYLNNFFKKNLNQIGLIAQGLKVALKAQFTLLLQEQFNRMSLAGIVQDRSFLCGLQDQLPEALCMTLRDRLAVAGASIGQSDFVKRYLEFYGFGTTDEIARFVQSIAPGFGIFSTYQLSALPPDFMLHIGAKAGLNTIKCTAKAGWENFKAGVLLAFCDCWRAILQSQFAMALREGLEAVSLSEIVIDDVKYAFGAGEFPSNPILPELNEIQIVNLQDLQEGFAQATMLMNEYAPKEKTDSLNNL